MAKRSTKTPKTKPSSSAATASTKTPLKTVSIAEALAEQRRIRGFETSKLEEFIIGMGGEPGVRTQLQEFIEQFPYLFNLETDSGAAAFELMDEAVRLSEQSLRADRELSSKIQAKLKFLKEVAERTQGRQAEVTKKLQEIITPIEQELVKKASFGAFVKQRSTSFIKSIPERLVSKIPIIGGVISDYMGERRRLEEDLEEYTGSIQEEISRRGKRTGGLERPDGRGSVYSTMGRSRKDSAADMSGGTPASDISGLLIGEKSQETLETISLTLQEIHKTLLETKDILDGTSTSGLSTREGELEAKRMSGITRLIKSVATAGAGGGAGGAGGGGLGLGGTIAAGVGTTIGVGLLSKTLLSLGVPSAVLAWMGLGGGAATATGVGTAVGAGTATGTAVGAGTAAGTAVGAGTATGTAVGAGTGAGTAAGTAGGAGLLATLMTYGGMSVGAAGALPTAIAATVGLILGGSLAYGINEAIDAAMGFEEGEGLADHMFRGETWNPMEIFNIGSYLPGVDDKMTSEQAASAAPKISSSISSGAATASEISRAVRTGSISENDAEAAIKKSISEGKYDSNFLDYYKEVLKEQTEANEEGGSRLINMRQNMERIKAKYGYDQKDERQGLVSGAANASVSNSTQAAQTTPSLEIPTSTITSPKTTSAEGQLFESTPEEMAAERQRNAQQIAQELQRRKATGESGPNWTPSATATENSSQSKRFYIANEEVRPGSPLSDKQMGAIELAFSMGNKNMYPTWVLEQYASQQNQPQIKGNVSPPPTRETDVGKKITIYGGELAELERIRNEVQTTITPGHQPNNIQNNISTTTTNINQPTANRRNDESTYRQMRDMIHVP